MRKLERFNSLRDFIDKLEAEGELLKIDFEVDPELEVTQIADLASKSKNGGKALLFTNLKGSPYKLLINTFGSRRRMALSLGVKDLEEIADDLKKLINISPPESLWEKIETLPVLFRLTKFPPKIISSSETVPCQEVVLKGDGIDLDKFPILKCWPEDGGKFITLPAVITKSLHTKRRNVGVYRMQVYDKKTTGMHWHIHKDGASYFHEYKQADRRMEVAVVIGADPSIVYAATAPMPHGLDELMLAGFIRNSAVELVKCKTIDMEVPKDAEIVLEGYVDPHELRNEGPFGDHTGYYSLEDDYPVFHITAITHRKDPIYLTTIVGKPPMEDCYMGKATERIFLPLLQKVHHEIVDYNLPWEGVFHNCVIISIDKRYPAHAKKVMSALWSTGQMAFAKMVMIVDKNINVSDYDKVARRLLNFVDIENDLIITTGILDVLDHSAPTAMHGAKIGIDATEKFDAEIKSEIEDSGKNDKEQIVKFLESVSYIVKYSIPYDDVKSRLAIISLKKTKPMDGINFAKEIIKEDTNRALKIILVLDEDVDPSDYSVSLWKFFNNVDPQRDIIKTEGRLIIDATKKIEGENHPRKWPDEITMDEKTIQTVNEKLAKAKVDLS